MKCQSCDSTWFAHAAGWIKSKSSKNFYCCKCQLLNGWDVEVATAGTWLCSRCAAAASASYEKDTSEVASAPPLADSERPDFFGNPVEKKMPKETGVRASGLGHCVGPLASAVREQPSSSSSSYVGPLASAMLVEPDSDVSHMKPLHTLKGMYSNFSIQYMLKKCSLSMQELMVFVRGEFCSKASRWNNLPLSLNSWGSKCKRTDVVDDAGVWTVETSYYPPGLKSSNEEYPSQKACEQKCNKTLEDLFVPAQITGLDHAETVGRHWRFDVVEQLVKSTGLQDRPFRQLWII